MKKVNYVLRFLLEWALICAGVLGSLYCLTTAFGLPMPLAVRVMVPVLALFFCLLFNGKIGKYYALGVLALNIFRVMDSQEDAYGFKGLRNLLKGMQFGKIYIMFGINECGYPTSSCANKYKEVVEEIREYQPDAIIYLQSICYVTQKKEQKDPTFSTANLKEKNETIKALANDVDIFYLEVNDCMNDGTDHLPSEYTGDGVHLKASYYSLWHQYLLEHAIVDANHPWSPEAEEAQGAEIEHP